MCLGFQISMYIGLHSSFPLQNFTHWLSLLKTMSYIHSVHKILFNRKVNRAKQRIYFKSKTPPLQRSLGVHMCVNVCVCVRTISLSHSKCHDVLFEDHWFRNQSYHVSNNSKTKISYCILQQLKREIPTKCSFSWLHYTHIIIFNVI